MNRILVFLFSVVLLSGCMEQKNGDFDQKPSQSTPRVNIEVPEKVEHIQKEEIQPSNTQPLEDGKDNVEQGENKNVEVKGKPQKEVIEKEAKPSENSIEEEETEFDQDLTELEDLEKEVAETFEKVNEIEKNLQELESLTQDLEELEMLEQELEDLEGLLK